MNLNDFQKEVRKDTSVIPNAFQAIPMALSLNSEVGQICANMCSIENRGGIITSAERGVLLRQIGYCCLLVVAIREHIGGDLPNSDLEITLTVDEAPTCAQTAIFLASQATGYSHLVAYCEAYGYDVERHEKLAACTFDFIAYAVCFCTLLGSSLQEVFRDTADQLQLRRMVASGP